MKIDEMPIKEIAAGKLVAIKWTGSLTYELTFLIGGHHFSATCTVDGGPGKIPLVQSGEHGWISSVGPIRWVAGVVIALARLNQEIPLPES
jgi:hypothetical protein